MVAAAATIQLRGCIIGATYYTSGRLSNNLAERTRSRANQRQTAETGTAPHNSAWCFTISNMNRLWIALAGAATLVALAAAIKRFVRHKRSTDIDVGTVSEGWLSEQRGRKDS